MLGAQSVPRPTDTSAETTAPLADSSIHDRLDKASPLVEKTHIQGRTGHACIWAMPVGPVGYTLKMVIFYVGQG